MKDNNENNTTTQKRTNINRNNVQSGVKAQLITLVIVLIIWIILGVSVFSLIKSFSRSIFSSQNISTTSLNTLNENIDETKTNIIKNLPIPIADRSAEEENLSETNNLDTLIEELPDTDEDSEEYADYDDYDLMILDMVYDEVINKGNEAYLYNFSSDELAIIRNTLYARRGYRFKKKKYQQYFGSKSWYTPTTDSQNILPKKEERLANIIKNYE